MGTFLEIRTMMMNRDIEDQVSQDNSAKGPWYKTTVGIVILALIGATFPADSVMAQVMNEHNISPESMGELMEMWAPGQPAWPQGHRYHFESRKTNLIARVNGEGGDGLGQMT